MTACCGGGFLLVNLTLRVTSRRLRLLIGAQSSDVVAGCVTSVIFNADMGRYFFLKKIVVRRQVKRKRVVHFWDS